MDRHHTSLPVTPGASVVPPPAPQPFRHKAIAGLMAALLGWTGAHWFYLGRRHGWVVLACALFLMGAALRGDPWYFHPAFFLFMIPVVAGFIEALVICLMPDARFDARYNPGHTRTTKTGWIPVLIAIATLAGGATALMITVALLFQGLFEGVLF